MTPDDLDFDRHHLWHPYSRCPDRPNIGIVGASGCLLETVNGDRLVDGMASWWSAIHGYNHPRLNAAIKEQVERFSHVMFGGLTHAPAVELGKRLLPMLPAGLDRIFLADSGSIAVEVALKMAIQYWRTTEPSQPRKHRFLTVGRGYHGDTFATMALCDPDNGMHRLFSDVFPKPLVAPAPEACQPDDWHTTEDKTSRSLAAMEDLISRHHDELAAVILEPVCQGAGGMRFYSPEYLCRLRALCDRWNLLLIFDEIATGFGRTGRVFALEHTSDFGETVQPDILCVGKALTGGYLTLAATITNQHVAHTISDKTPLMHGPTFMGNPLACAVACASIDLLNERPWKQEVAHIESHFRETLLPLADHPAVSDVRVLGAVGVVEMKDPIDLPSATEFLVRRGVWLRPFGKLLYSMPPYAIQPAELERLTQAMADWVARQA